MYALKRIAEIQEVTDYKKANDLLKQNWSLRDVVTKQNEIVYVMIRVELLDSSENK